MKNTLLTLAALAILNIVSAQKPARDTVYFDIGKHTITLQSKTRLDQLIQTINDCKVKQVLVTGYTDNKGADNLNKSLSKQRADAVFDFLAANGIESSKIKTDYKAQLQPAADNMSEAGRQRNRRVEIMVEYEQFSIPQNFMVSFNTFLVNPARDTTLVINAKGTALHIPKNCFMDKQGRPVKQNVSLQYREYDDAAEMAFSYIPMTYKNTQGDYHFNSAGMFEITGTAGGQPVDISEDKSMKIDFALAQKTPDLGFYKLNDDKSGWKKMQDINLQAGKVETRMIESKTTIGDTSTEALVTDSVFGDDKVRVKKGRWNHGKFISIGAPTVSAWKDNGDRKSSTLIAIAGDAGHTYPSLVRGLNIGTFGVYNCDQCYRLANTININPKYVDEQGKEIKDLYVLSLIDLKFNGAFSFDPRSFTCDSKGQNVLALFTAKGDLYISDKSAFSGVERSGAHTFTMKNMTTQIKSSKELANYLGIKM